MEPNTINGDVAVGLIVLTLVVSFLVGYMTGWTDCKKRLKENGLDDGVKK